MNEVKQLVTDLFKRHHIQIPANRENLFNQFLQDQQETINAIIQNQNQLMAKWKTEDRMADIMKQPVRVVNGTVGKPYEAKFDIEKLNWKDISTFQFAGLEEAGLLYDEKTKQITGIPTKSGDRENSFPI